MLFLTWLGMPPASSVVCLPRDVGQQGRPPSPMPPPGTTLHTRSSTPRYSGVRRPEVHTRMESLPAQDAPRPHTPMHHHQTFSRRLLLAGHQTPAPRPSTTLATREEHPSPILPRDCVNVVKSVTVHERAWSPEFARDDAAHAGRDCGPDSRP